MEEMDLTANNAIITLCLIAQINEEFRSLLNLCYRRRKYDKLALDSLLPGMIFEPQVSASVKIKADFMGIIELLSDVSDVAQENMDHEVYEKAKELIGRLRGLEGQTEQYNKYQKNNQ